jgi:hypothetical protein
MVWTKDAHARLEAFENSAQSAKDKRLVAWLKLQLLAEEIETLRTRLSNLADSDIRESNLSIDPQTVQNFERRFTEWRDDGFDVMDGTVDHLEMAVSSTLTNTAQIPCKFTSSTVAVNCTSLSFYRGIHVQSFFRMLESK